MSRRRCDSCWVLKRDAEVKQGPIAHLDGNASTNDMNNLAFLCLPHHDDFDEAGR